MSKMMIKIEIVSNNDSLIEELDCNFDEKKHIVEYIENSNTKVILDMSNNILIRENNEIYMEFLFDLNNITKNKLLIKEFNKKIDLNIKTNKIINNLSSYIVAYNILDGDSFEYKIEIFNK